MVIFMLKEENRTTILLYGQICIISDQKLRKLVKSTTKTSTKHLRLNSDLNTIYYDFLLLVIELPDII